MYALLNYAEALGTKAQQLELLSSLWTPLERILFAAFSAATLAMELRAVGLMSKINFKYCT